MHLDTALQALRARMLGLRERAAALSEREQSLALTVLAVAIYFGADAWLLTPQQLQLQTLLETQSSTQAQLVAAKEQLTRIRATTDEQTLRHEAESAQLRTQLALIEHINAKVHAEPGALDTLVGEVLKADHPRVSLKRLKTLPVKPLLPSNSRLKGDKATTSTATLYRHGVEIEVRGTYLDLLAYVQSLESQGQGILWSDMKLSTLSYPESALRITLYTLSKQNRLRLS